jgi:hypothetical protein
MKRWKVFTEAEIAGASSKMEQTRRKFWNDKAEQLASLKPERSGMNKTTVSGIIDVSWTLRKTAIIENNVNETLDKEKIILGQDGMKKIGSQKKETIPKNLQRMETANLNVQRANANLEKVKEEFEKAKSTVEEEKNKKQWKRSKDDMDEAYTKLKQAQDATMKALVVKQQQLEKYLTSNEKKMDQMKIIMKDTMGL